MMEKPKCPRCNEISEEPFYYWVNDARGKGGELLHYSCAVKRQDIWLRVEKGLAKLEDEISKRLNQEDSILEKKN